MRIKFKPPTPRMIEFMHILFNDCGFNTKSRNAWLSDLLRRPINHLDEISLSEGHLVIDKLKDIRDGQRTRFETEDEIEF